MRKHLLIKLEDLDIRKQASNHFSYFSFSISDLMHFSSSFSHNSQSLTDDIIMPLPKKIPSHINLQRWENHMILFNHSIDVTELKTRKSTKKKHQTKCGQILSFTLTLLEKEEMIFNQRFISSISQHYLILSNFKLRNNKESKRKPSFFILRTTHADAILPFVNAQLCIKLPESVEIQHVKEGKSQATSDRLKLQQIQSQGVLNVELEGRTDNKLSMDISWVTNMQEGKAEDTLLLEAHQILIYDIEIKLNNHNEFGNCRVKFVYGNKGYEVGSDFSHSKMTRIKKIIYIITKSEQDQISIVVEKNSKVISLQYLFTEELQIYTINTIKKKLLNQEGEPFGQIKFKAEKAKNLAGPFNPNSQKESFKKKISSSIGLSFRQVSVMYKRNEDVSVVVKSETDQWEIPQVPNFQFYDPQSGVSPIAKVVNAKQEEGIYLMVKETDLPSKKQINQGDFIGIGILNTSDLRIGLNCVQIECFKNQEKTVVINCMINKIVPFPLIKATFQSEKIPSKKNKTFSFQMILRKVCLTPYFYTFQYENKSEMYCIAELNGVKKVLILQNLRSELEFGVSTESDSLNFTVEKGDFLKLKMVFMIADIGQQQEIYGSLTFKIKAEEFQESNSLFFEDIPIRNNFELQVGSSDVQISKTERTEQKTTERSRDLFKSKKGLESRQSRQVSSERTANKNRFSNSYRKKLNSHEKSQNHEQQVKKSYDIKLPVIKESRQDNLKDYFQFMKVRKRQMKGYDEAKTIETYGRVEKKEEESRQVGISKIQRQNPNLSRNLEILFPKKQKRNRNVDQRRRLDRYAQNLKGLKSVYNEISQDMGEIEPTNKDSRQRENSKSFHKIQWSPQQFSIQ